MAKHKYKIFHRRESFFANNRGVTKTHQVIKGGDIKWIQKKPSRILLCECGRKYLKTRPLQYSCLFCHLGTLPVCLKH